MAGFGGVAEYGITVRWDKNFLKIVRLLLERRQPFAMFGGVRFGGTLTRGGSVRAWASTTSRSRSARAGPTVLDMPNGLARGVRTASDFLMALQLTGAAKTDSIANMQLRLPVVVVGGGLTAIDTATESLAYYPLQVEKFLQRYERSRASTARRRRASPGTTRSARSPTSSSRTRARSARGAQRAAAEEREPRVLELLQSWGGVTIAYRRRLIDSPSYTLNHEEVQKALEEGMRFAEGLTPLGVELDELRPRARAAGSRCRSAARTASGSRRGAAELPARTILDRGRHAAQHRARARGRGALQARRPLFPGRATRRATRSRPEKAISKPNEVRVLLDAARRRTLHELFRRRASVVLRQRREGDRQRRSRAIPSSAACSARSRRRPRESDASSSRGSNDELRATVHEVVRLTPMIVEVVVRAPLAARRFRPGPVLPPAELRDARAAAPKARASRWKGSR